MNFIYGIDLTHAAAPNPLASLDLVEWRRLWEVLVALT
jgi:hypothetical protein